jgi:hypothetical protein
MSTISLKLPRPHAGQQRIRSEARRFNVVNCGRRFGKTKYGLNLLVECALSGYPVAWFAPTYKTLSEPWREAKKLLKPITRSANASEKRIELITGGVIEFWSLTDADNIRGRKYKRALVDEAAMVRSLKVSWEQVIRPMLADFRGDGYFFSTPKGRNYFHELFQRGQDATQRDWMSFQLPTSTNPYIPADEIEAARLELPELVFMQEFLAQFIDDNAGLFRKVLAAAIAEASLDDDGRPVAIPGHSYVFGVDWGRSGDYTVVSVIDNTTKQQVYIDRFNQVDYDIQKGRLISLYETFQPSIIVAEENSFGGPLVADLRQNLPIQPFTTSNASKKEIIDSLALSLERGDLEILNDAVQVGELLSFEQTRLPSGLFRYAAAGNGHDDTVIALALSHYASGRPSPSGYVSFL